MGGGFRAVRAVLILDNTSHLILLVFKGLYDSPVSILQLGKKIFPKSYLEMA